MSGEKQVHIFGEIYDVNAEVRSILSLSAHADYKEIFRFFSCQDKDKLKGIFLVHGEQDVKVAFKERLMKEGYKNVVIPAKGETQHLM